MANKPIYVFGCENDNVVPLEYQRIQRDYFENYNANVKFVAECAPNEQDPGHMWTKDGPYNMLQYLYENLAGTGVTAGSPLVKPDVSNVENIVS